MLPLLLLVALSWTQETLPPEMQQLVRIKQRMKDNLERLPNYTCLATVQRYDLRRGDATWLQTDRFRVEVALVGDAEWFSHPGAGRLETKNLREIVPVGMISFGEFGTHARTIFLSGSPRFEYAGTEKVNQRNTVRFNYTIPLFGSGYRITSGKATEQVGYHGSFWADPESGDVVRMDVHPDDLPKSLGLASSYTVVDYSEVRIGSTDFLLPQHTDIMAIRSDRTGGRNQITFSNCRQYTTESAVSFQDPASLPAGLALALKLETALDSEKTHPGDAVTASVVSELRGPVGTLVPAGARVRGRVLQFDHPPGGFQFRVALQFDVIDAGDVHYPFTALLVSLPDDRRYRRAPDPSPLPGVVTLMMRQLPFRIESLLTRWRTQ